MKNSLLSICLLLVVICFGQKAPPKYEFRGLWVTTAFNLDWPSINTLPPAEQQKEFIELLDHHKKNGINTVIVQVRAAADAFYKSNLEPWSYWLTGEQGKAPEPYWDPLAFMIQECHKRDMELHAWFNLFRAVSHDRFFKTTKDHITRKHPEWTYKMGSKVYFNPGVPALRDYLVQVVVDCVKNYDIDGIHLDDYFYAQESKKEKVNDAKTFKKHNPNKIKKLSDWRRNNINLLIHSLADSIHVTKKNMKFGISPAPVWRHYSKDKRGSKTDRTLTAYDDLYADSRRWIEQGWVDYLVPQLYYSTKHSRVNYNKLLDWYDNNSFNRHMYVGLAYYKLAEPDEAGWKDKEELPRQINLLRSRKNISGYCFFRASSFKGNPLNMENQLQSSINKHFCVAPPMLWLDSIPPNPPSSLSITPDSTQLHLKWTPATKAADGELAHRYIVYRFEENENLILNSSDHIISFVDGVSFTDTNVVPGKAYLYIVTSLDRMHNESKGFIGSWSEVK